MVSWREENWPDRGNDYPGGASLSDTLRGLSEGTAYQVHLRAWYTPGSTPTPRGAAPGPVERPLGPWSGDRGQYYGADPSADAGTNTDSGANTRNNARTHVGSGARKHRRADPGQ